MYPELLLSKDLDQEFPENLGAKSVGGDSLLDHGSSEDLGHQSIQLKVFADSIQADSD